MKPTVLAEIGICFMTFLATVLTASGGTFALLHHHGGGHDASWHSDNGIAQHHDEGGKELARSGHWTDVTITYGGDGDNGPIDGSWDTIEALIIGRLDDVHDRAEDTHHQQYEEQEDGDFGSAGTECRHQVVALAQEDVQLEDAEHPQEPERTHDE